MNGFLTIGPEMLGGFAFLFILLYFIRRWRLNVIRAANAPTTAHVEVLSADDVFEGVTTHAGDQDHSKTHNTASETKHAEAVQIETAVKGYPVCEVEGDDVPVINIGEILNFRGQTRQVQPENTS